MFGGLEVLQCYNPHKTEGFARSGCYKGATEVLQVLQKEKRKSENRESGDSPAGDGAASLQESSSWISSQLSEPANSSSPIVDWISSRLRFWRVRIFSSIVSRVMSL